MANLLYAWAMQNPGRSARFFSKKWYRALPMFFDIFGRPYKFFEKNRAERPVQAVPIQFVWGQPVRSSYGKVIQTVPAGTRTG
eukprot:SAG11_NODE_1385_length_5070_cov_3.950915_3_plen_83_part_00